MHWSLEEWNQLAEAEQALWLEREELRVERVLEAIHWASEHGSVEAMMMARLSFDLY